MNVSEIPCIGDWVYLRAYGDEIIHRRVVDVKSKGRDTTVYVCRHEEYQAAAREGREPQCVGFAIDDIVPAPEAPR